MISPDMWPLNFELARNAMVFAMSSGVAIFFKGIVAIAPPLIRGFLNDSRAISVDTHPGATTFARPCG